MCLCQQCFSFRLLSAYKHKQSANTHVHEKSCETECRDYYNGAKCAYLRHKSHFPPSLLAVLLLSMRLPIYATQTHTTENAP